MVKKETSDAHQEKPINKRRWSPTDVTGVIDLTQDGDTTTTASNISQDGDDDDWLESLCKRTKLENDSDRESEEVIALDVEDEDIQVVEADTAPLTAAAAAVATSDNKSSSGSNEGDDDDDIQVVGMVNEQRLPHMRQHCTRHRFLASNAIGVSTIQEREKVNTLHCNRCYCYVCDCPVRDCKSWKEHCHATDQGVMASYWRNRRALHKQKNQPQTGQERTQTAPDTAPHHGQQPPQQQPSSNHCRHCQERFDLTQWRNAGGDENRPTWADWCRTCGRVARACDLSKGNTKDKNDNDNKLRPRTTVVPLGRQTIPFSMVSRDPRKLLNNSDTLNTYSIYSNNFNDWKMHWADHAGEPGWNYSEPDMQEEMFQHRLGPRPALRHICNALPDRTGPFFDEETGKPLPAKTLVWNAEVVLVPDWNHRLVLQTLHRILQKGSSSSYATIEHNLTAAWDKEQMKGTFELDLSIQYYGNHVTTSEIGGLALLLGAWFGGGIFPLELTDISGLLSAQTPPKQRGYSSYWDDDEDDDDEKETLEDVEVARLQAARASRIQSHSIQPSNNHQDEPSTTTIGAAMGGTSTSRTDWRAALSRYYEEMLPVFCMAWDEDNPYGRPTTLEAVDKKGLLVDQNRSLYYGCTTRDCLDSFLTYREEVVCYHLLNKSAERLFQGYSQPQDLMRQLENLGHEAAPYIEGLNIELLPFQKQTLQWAAERETVPGGVNSYTWTQLSAPTVAAAAAPSDNNHTAAAGDVLYLNPALQKLSRTKPPLVRGGFIAEEMGLGKTVISLALVLRNPAPAQPESGSPCTSLTTTATTPLGTAGAAATAGTTTPFWDPDLTAKIQATSIDSKRGKILSRGTLVVCTVSLVGQWIDEAKSKLKDPGLVYSYHGGSRKRDPRILARNSIVVTTYETLASDDTFHRKKSPDPDNYCPPCEQVRWWRIICDESHVLRNSSIKVDAVLDLVGDCKWLVTGTPVNTGLSDLKNQLRFLGLDDVATFCRNVNIASHRRRARFGGNVKKFDEWSRYRKMLFLLRPILMRHSQEQTYSGTTTTLMSLPPKSERVVQVTLSDGDAAEYKTMEKSAREAYVAFKAKSTKKVGTGFLKLSQMLLPLRVACAGGRTPLAEDCVHADKHDDDEEEEPDENEDAHGEAEGEENGTQHKKRKKRVVRYSKYAFTSKLFKLIEELERVRDEDETSKSLVFSQFGSTLKWLQEELPKHGFQFRTLSGDMPMRKRAKALHDFQNDPPTTVFLLSMRAGAVGINLTQANRVFLLEPHFNPALELQAIGRVHRLGQRREVEIIRLVVEDSVESRMVQMLENKYGTTTGEDAADGDDGCDDYDEVQDDEKEATASSCIKNGVTAMVGSLKSERVDVVEGEFDLLFGLDCCD